LRIIFYAPRASQLDPRAIGGDGPIVHSLLTGLPARGHEVRVASRIDVRDFWLDRVPAHRLATEAFAVHRELKRFSPDAWLVFGSCLKHPDLFGWWQRPVRYVVMGPGTSAGRRVPKRWRWLLRWAHQRSLHRADRVVAFHPKSADELRSLGVRRERLSVLPPPVEFWDEIPSRQESRALLELPKKAPIVLCVSRLTQPRNGQVPYKTEAVVELLRALAQLPSDILLVVVGDGPGRAMVEDTTAALGMVGRVQLVGTVRHTDVRRFYAACDFFAYPCLVDRPWVAVLEAQSCGRPVVTMQTRSAEVTVEHGHTALLAKDMQDFKAHMAALASDRERCDEMGRSAREYIAKTHSFAVRVEQIEGFLREPR
jgi:glycosyltransferase involved in cell wall biosynthesis